MKTTTKACPCCGRYSSMKPGNTICTWCYRDMDRVPLMRHIAFTIVIATLLWIAWSLM